MSYRQLDQAAILKTLEQLQLRIAERFPQSGLSRVATELLGVGREIASTVEYLRKPDRSIRIPVWIGIIFLLAVTLTVLVMLAGADRTSGQVGGWSLLPLLEATVNDVVFLGIAIYFLLSIETKVKRKRALGILHELRSLAHVVDMHQLTKDPERLLSGTPDTEHSPARTMTAPEMGRYLDYCSELLSLTSKLAALLVQHFSDEVVLAAVTEIEGMTASLSGGIWQKITLLGDDRHRIARTSARS
jgi:hypothetical protein